MEGGQSNRLGDNDEVFDKFKKVNYFSLFV